MLGKKDWRDPDKCFRPDVRWWLAEGFHTDQTLKTDIRLLDESGFGAVEFLAMEDDGVDSGQYGWGSEEWVHDSQLIIEETTARGMGVSTTSGTNWANANLTTITPDDRAALKELDFMSVTVPAGSSWEGMPILCELTVENVHKQELVAVLAGRRVEEQGPTVVLDESSMQLLPAKAEEIVCFTAPEDGDYELFFFWMHGTGQTAEPSASVNYTVNYFDRDGVEAVIDYWSKYVLTEDLQETINRNGRVMMYMDSLELNNWGKGGRFWGYCMAEEFKRRRGYDLLPFLPFVTKHHKDRGIDMMLPVWRYEMLDTSFSERLRNDFFQTWTDLYMENMLQPLQKWLHTKNMQLRAEISYGLPFEISQPGKYVDGVETESLEFASQIDSYRNLAGTSHIYRRLFSSETGANLYNYMLPLNFYTQIIFTQFAAGVARTVLHGYSSIAGSDGATQWPGHEGMYSVFAERFGSRQPASVHYEEWTRMVGRFQMLLRQGRPRVDLAVLRLDYYINNMFMQYGPEKDTYEKKFMRANEGLYLKNMELQNSGFTYEYFAPQLLEEAYVDYEDGMLDPLGAGYQAVLVYQEYMPLSSAEKLLKLARKGLPVLLIDGAREMEHVHVDRYHRKACCRTPYNDQEDEKLAVVMQELEQLPSVRRVPAEDNLKNVLMEMGVCARNPFDEENAKILTAYREADDMDYLYLYHYMYTDTLPFCFRLTPKCGGDAYLLHCMEGSMERARQADGKLEICLKPGEAVIVAFPKSEEAKENLLESIPLEKDAVGTYHEQEVTEWDLTVEDWNEGRKVEILEDRGLGLVTREVYYETAKEERCCQLTDLEPWKNIPEIGKSVSGIGRYAAVFQMEKVTKAVLAIGGTYGNTAAIYVNGQKIQGFDSNRLEIDISDYVQPGDNHLVIEVSSTLKNRLLARGYYDKMIPMFKAMAKIPPEETIEQECPEPYGLCGPVRIKSWS